MSRFESELMRMYRTEPRLSFRQVYLSPERRGDAAEDAARALLARLGGAGPEASVQGDALMVPDALSDVPRGEVARLFGEDFATRLVEIEPGSWTGPVESGYGWHVVFVRERTLGRVPELAEVRDAIEREWVAARRKEVVEATYQKLRERYTVVIERTRGGSARARLRRRGDGA